MIVIDASVWVSLLIPQDVHHAATSQWFQDVVRHGVKIFEPVILAVEVASAVARRTGDSAAARLTSEQLFEISAIEWLSLDRQLAEASVEIASELKLRGADAVYVAVARSRNLPLVTWDVEQLQRAASVITVQTPTSEA